MPSYDPQRVPTHLPFFAFLLLFVGLTTISAWVFPELEGSDEPLHVAVTAHIRETGTLPNRTDYLTSCTRQQSGQPPLLYGLGAVVLDMTRAPLISCDAVFRYAYDVRGNPWLLSPDAHRRDDNNTNFLPLTTVSPPAGLPRALFTLRLVSVAFGALAVVGAYLAAGELFQGSAWRLTTVIVFAFTPTFAHVSSYFTNDTPAIAFTTLILWRALVALRQPPTIRQAALTGILIGLGGLAKVSVLLVAPVWVLAVGIEQGLSSRTRQAWLRRGAAVMVAAGVALVIFGMWAGYGLLTYGDPLGTGTHIHPVLNYDPPLTWATTLRDTPNIYRTYTGLLGYANVYLPEAAYYVLTGVLGLALVGYSRYRLPPLQWQQALILLAVWVIFALGFLRWYRTIYGVTGRLLLPAHLAYAVLIVGGLRAWGRFGVGRVLQVLAVCAFVLVGIGYSATSLYAAYTPRTLAELPPLQGAAFTFDDTIRLAGYQVESDIIHNGEIHTITLCWEVLRQTDRLAAYNVRYVRDGIPTASRTTIHGLGRYNSTQWQAGAIFCDAVDMAVGDAVYGATTPQPGVRYDILVTLLDARTGDVNWQATASDGTPVQFPVLGQVIAAK